MKVLFAASEGVPFVKTGGLADVVGNLPRVLQKSGRADVSVVLPKYGCIDTANGRVVPTGFAAEVPVGGGAEWAEVWQCAGDVPVYLLSNPRYFGRTYPYQEHGRDYPDNAERFIFFSRAVVELCNKLNFWPDVLHCHDWHTALIPAYVLAYNTYIRPLPVTTVLTVHNPGYQGRFHMQEFAHAGLPSNLTDPAFGFTQGDELNFLRIGVMCSDIITTVSPRYSEEIKFAPHGHGLEELFRHRAGDLFGILNGIDTDEWNPATDPFIPSRYHVDDLSGKAVCKRHVQSQLGLAPRDDVPLLATIMRLSVQKGMHLIDAVIDALADVDVQFLLVGAGDPAAEDRARNLASRYAGKFAAIVGEHISYDSSVVHRVEAAADMFVMPSLYEPCGLNQMFSLRYGAVPVVRGTGGLDDTVREYNPDTGEGNGFKFYEPTPQAFGEALAGAIHYYTHRKGDWLRMMQNGMQADFSWDRAAADYLSLYEHAMARKAHPVS